MDIFDEVARKLVSKENDTRIKIRKNDLPYYVIIDEIGQAFTDWYRDESGEPLQVVNGAIRPMKAISTTKLIVNYPTLKGWACTVARAT